MNNFSKTFFQVVLLLLALAFTFTIRFLCSTESSQTFTSSENKSSNITLSEVFSSQLDGER